ncbi:keratin, type I cytoskeletal 10 isoform X3 [Tribolium castaneum]|uniref:keratin, type I cytoskeletal 10 isoform X3 n=1 Tax=Tribolium castaneum TaxID=7070 RepID=UPI00046C2A6D|nr:PREDICTED: keratin, type I cytoskeletal 10 isoform X3 [Tribolium castaneum]|eukprot:XP_008200073.1 PREDICTED: keratin, type I cytoskeletal 10 isoform X3 [Tribolium castaneum]
MYFTMGLRNTLIFVALVSCVLAYSGEFVPKSYYIIDQDGHKSDVVYFRSKRDVESFPLFRVKRGGGSSSSSQSSASSSSSSGAGFGAGGGGAGGGGIPFQGGSAKLASSTGGGGGGGSGAFAHSFASSSSSGSSGIPSGFGGVGGTAGPGYKGPILFSRFGEDTGNGVKVSSSAQGPRGAFSSSSSSIDSDGKIKYSVKSGKY